MDILKKENWWIWLLVELFSGGSGIIALAALLDCFDKDAWYANWKNWVIGAVCFIFPVFIMIIVFVIQMLCQVAARLDVPGKEIYLSPYIWILALIVPIFGWIFFYVTVLYLRIWNLVMLYKGSGEKYIGNV